MRDKIEIAVEAAKKAGIEILKFYGKEVELERKRTGPIDPGGLCFSRFIVGCIVVYGIPIVSEEGESLLLEEMGTGFRSSG